MARMQQAIRRCFSRFVSNILSPSLCLYATFAQVFRRSGLFGLFAAFNFELEDLVDLFLFGGFELAEQVLPICKVDTLTTASR